MFFGWANIKWFIKEFVAMYSSKESYFSKKRFESSMAFLGGYWIILYHVWSCRLTISNSEILADAALLFGIAGYTVTQIEKNKVATPTKPVEEPKSPPAKDDDLVA